MATTTGSRRSSTSIDWRRLVPDAVRRVNDGRNQAARAGVPGWAIYVRISKDRTGAGLGVERQCQDSLQLADQMGVPVVDIYVDNDMSAYSGRKRPDYERLLTDISEGRISGVLAWHPDRVHRAPTELERYIDVCHPRSVPTHTVMAGLLDLSTANGRLNARITGAVARHESELKGERIQRQKLQAAQEGRPLGGPRFFGFEDDGLALRPDEAAEIRAGTEAILAGASLRSVVEAVNARRIGTNRGGDLWERAPFRRMLLRPRNAGLSAYRGEIVGKGQWDEIITEEEWRALVSILTDPSRRTAMTNRVRWLGSGLYVCGGCGEASMRVSTSGSRRIRVYRCLNRTDPDIRHVSRSVEAVDDLVERVIVERLSAPDAHQLLAEPGEEIDVAALQVEAAAKRRRLDDLASAFAEGEISRSQLKTGTEALRRRLDQIQGEIATAGQTNPLADLIGAPDTAVAWRELDIGRRRTVLDALMTVKLLPTTRGRKATGGYFDPESVEITWKR